MIYIASVDGQEYEIEILSETRVLINGREHEIDFEPLRQQLSYSLLADGRSYEVNIYRDNGGWEVLLRGRQFSIEVEDERERRLRLAAGHEAVTKGRVTLKAPMPGLVIDIPVKEGDQVAKGDVLVVLESMKMQNELTAPRDGTVARVQAQVNDNVDRNQVLLALE